VPSRQGSSSISSSARCATGRIEGTDNGVPLVSGADPVNNVVAGAASMRR
jgi:hypothetical protein